MGSREVQAGEVSRLLRVLAHPERVLLIQLLAALGEIDVGDMARELGVPPTRVSQHLALMRAHRLVTKARQGRHRLYTLSQPALAAWLSDGVGVLTRLAQGKAPGTDSTRTLGRED